MPATVTVACKIPAGLHLEMPDRSDARKKVRFTIKGSSGSRVIGGYGLTENVPADFFAEWMKSHADQPYVKKGMIFAQERLNMVEGQAREQAAIKSGFERLDPAKPGPGLEKLKME